MAPRIPARPGGNKKPRVDPTLQALLDGNFFEFFFRLITGDSGWFGSNGFFGRIIEAVTLQGMRWTQVDDQQEVINDHTNSIEQLEAAFNQLVLQGNAIVFTSNNTYYPSPGIVSVDIILLGGGGGGGGGRWNALAASRNSGGGGGGGGEVHTNVPASLLPKTGDAFDPIPIYVGQFGAGGNTNGSAGGGGGNTSFGPYLTAGGGVGGMSLGGAISPGGAGGSGMIPGGAGGDSDVHASDTPAEGGGNSTSAYDLHGGGGGGGGAVRALGSAIAGKGGVGGISPGGTPGNSRDGTPPSTIVATGGGGGAGAPSGSYPGGTGAVPSGGGGGGYGGASGQVTAGGNGGQGMVFVIERMA